MQPIEKTIQARIYASDHKRAKSLTSRGVSIADVIREAMRALKPRKRKAKR